MKVVLVGMAEVDGRSGPVWDMVRGVLQSLAPTDVLVHSGGGGTRGHTLGSMVDSILRRAKGAEKRRMPKAEVQVPEIGRWNRAEALRQNAAQLVQHHQPHVVVYVGDGSDAETTPVLEFVEAYNRMARETRLIAVYEAAEFIAERRQRGA